MTEKGGLLAGLPDPSKKPDPIPDALIRLTNAPAWSYARLQISIFLGFGADGRDARTIIAPERSIASVTLVGFPHIDANTDGIGMEAAAICQDLINPETLSQKTWYSPDIGLESSLCPLEGPLRNKGPFDIAITAETGNLVFTISSTTAESTAEAIKIPTLQIRSKGRSFQEFTDSLKQLGPDVPTNKRRAFEAERQNAHNDHAAYIAEKFAQQNWYVGQTVARLLFELTLFVATPNLAAKAARELKGDLAGRTNMMGGPKQS